MHAGRPAATKTAGRVCESAACVTRLTRRPARAPAARRRASACRTARPRAASRPMGAAAAARSRRPGARRCPAADRAAARTGEGSLTAGACSSGELCIDVRVIYWRGQAARD